MLHKDILNIPVGSEIVLSERTDNIHRANTRNSIIGVLESHQNHQAPYWRGIYWRKMEDTFDLAPDKTAKKWYFVSTLTEVNGVPTKVKSLVSGKNILGIYNEETKKLWEERDRIQATEEAEQERQAAIISEVRQLGATQAQQEQAHILATLSGILGKPLEEGDKGISVHVRQDNPRWLDAEKTRAVPTTNGTITMSSEFFSELMEKMYESLDAR